ncbi:MAG: helix-turn-helix transcriptional regulator [Lentisphaeria bacterium]|nr:helix-turn-helix transcriptional regulator [Lentisphaeria bacterium]
MKNNILEVVRGDCVETYSANWLSNNRHIRYGNLNMSPVADGYEPFYSTLFPRYGAETVRRNIPSWFRFRNAVEMTVELLLDGVMHYEQDKISEEVRPGELYIIHKGSDTRFEQRPGEHFHRLRLMFCGSLIVPLTDSLQLTGKRVIALHDPDAMAARFRKIIDLMVEHSPGTEAEISSLSYSLLAGIAGETGRRDRFPPRFERILHSIGSDLSCRRSIAGIAQENGCGVHTLMRLFRKYLGVSPSAWRDHLRFEQACRMLQSTDLSVKEISERLGYCDQLYFSAAFRKRAGIPPSAFRKEKYRVDPE